MSNGNVLYIVKEVDGVDYPLYAVGGKLLSSERDDAALFNTHEGATSMSEYIYEERGIQCEVVGVVLHKIELK